MKCPVCPQTDIQDDATVCPNCGVDLTPIRRVRELAVAHYNEAVRSFEAGETAAAIVQATTALGVDEGFVPARKLLGKLLWQKGRSREALDQWKRAAALAPEDQELQELRAVASRAVKRRAVARVGVVVGGLMVLVCLVLVGTGSLLQERDSLKSDYASLQGRLQQEAASADNEVKAFTAYRETHSHTDAEYVALADSAAKISRNLEGARTKLEQGRASTEEMSRAFASYREIHTNTDDQYEALETALAEARRELSNAQTQLANQRSLEKQLAAEISELRDQLSEGEESRSEAIADLQEVENTLAARNRWLRQSLVPLIHSLRPPNADILSSEIEKARTELGQLRELDARYVERGVFPVDTLRVRGIRQRTERAQEELRTLEKEYEERVVPWQQAMNRLQTEVDGWLAAD